MACGWRSVLAIFLSGSALGSATAGAVGLDDYLWERRPLLLFAPTEGDPRLLETLARIEASGCEFADRDMVIGLVVAEGTSTLGGQVLDAVESRRLADTYAIGGDAFAVVLIGKDGGEKLRVDDVPDRSHTRLIGRARRVVRRRAIVRRERDDERVGGSSFVRPGVAV